MAHVGFYGGVRAVFLELNEFVRRQPDADFDAIRKRVQELADELRPHLRQLEDEAAACYFEAERWRAKKV